MYTFTRGVYMSYAHFCYVERHNSLFIVTSLCLFLTKIFEEFKRYITQHHRTTDEYPLNLFYSVVINRRNTFEVNVCLLVYVNKDVHLSLSMTYFMFKLMSFKTWTLTKIPFWLFRYLAISLMYWSVIFG